MATRSRCPWWFVAGSLASKNETGSAGSARRASSWSPRIDAEMPILAPASIQDVLDYGLIGWELSRYSGLWASMICREIDSPRPECMPNGSCRGRSE